MKTHYRQIAEVKTDSKNRISLGRKLRCRARHYRVYEDDQTGAILLEPLAVVPLSEPWLDRNPRSKASLERGLSQAKAGELVEVRENFTKFAGKGK